MFQQQMFQRGDAQQLRLTQREAEQKAFEKKLAEITDKLKIEFFTI